MLPVSHCFRVMRPFRSTSTSAHDASTLCRRTAVSMNLRATFSACGDTGAFLSCLISCAGVVEIGDVKASPVPRRTTSETNAAVPIRKMRMLPIRILRWFFGEVKKPEP